MDFRDKIDRILQDPPSERLPTVREEIRSIFERAGHLSRDQRASLHRRISHHRDEHEQWIVNVVRQRLLQGSGRLKNPLEDHIISMDDIIDAIKQNRCLNIGPEGDIGHESVRNSVGNAIQHEFPMQRRGYRDVTSVNDARRVFGLKPIAKRPNDPVKQG